MILFVYVVCCREEEGRRYLMMEQDGQPQGLPSRMDPSQGTGQHLDTVLPASPTPTTSSDYASAEEDAFLPPACPPTSSTCSPTCRSPLSGSDSQPHTPGSISSIESYPVGGGASYSGDKVDGMDPFLGVDDLSELAKLWTEDIKSSEGYFTGSQGLDGNVDMVHMNTFGNSDNKLANLGLSAMGSDEQMDVDHISSMGSADAGRHLMANHNILKGLLVPEDSNDGSHTKIPSTTAAGQAVQKSKQVRGLNNVNGTTFPATSNTSHTVKVNNEAHPIMVTSIHQLQQNGVSKPAVHIPVNRGASSMGVSNGHHPNMATHSFPAANLLGTDNLSASSDFAMKFAENLVNEQVTDSMINLAVVQTLEEAAQNADFSSLLSEPANPECHQFPPTAPPSNYRSLNSLGSSSSSPSPSPQQLSPKTPLTPTSSPSFNTNPAASSSFIMPSSKSSSNLQSKSGAVRSFMGYDDHSYTSKCPQPPSNSKSTAKNGHRHHHHHHHHHHHNHKHSASHQRTGGNSVLECFLLSKQPLDPNKGSDAIAAAQGISQLDIGDSDFSDRDWSSGIDNQTLLERLLTGRMDKREVNRSRQTLIATRRSEPMSPEQSTVEDMVGLDSDPLLDGPDPLGMGLLGEEPLTDIDNLWPSSNTDQEVSQ